MAYDFSEFKKKSGEIAGWLSRELSAIRTGRAAAAVLDPVTVEAYGSRQPLKAVAAVSLEDARTIKIAPWDQGLAKAIETGITAANLGLSVVPDGSGFRVIFPELTGERRLLLVKTLKEKLEQARISLKKERETVWNDIQSKERSGALAEDDKFRAKDELQKLIDAANADIEATGARKEAEIMN